MKLNLKAEKLNFVLMLIFVGAMSIFPITDNDAWWHVKTGEYIIYNAEIPETDPFSYTITGKKWVVFEYLSQIIFYGIFSVSGINGLILFKSVIVLLIFVILYKTSVKDKLSVLELFIFLLAFTVCRDAFRVRPQIFSFLLGSVFIYILRKGDFKKLYFLILLGILWANLHGAISILGLLIITAYMAFSYKQTPFKNKALLIFLYSGAILVNPYGTGVITYLIKFYNSGLSNLLLEFQSLNFSLWFVPFYLYLLLLSASFVLTGKEINKEGLAIASILTLASFSAVRNIPFMVLLTLPACIENIGKYISKTSIKQIFPAATSKKTYFASVSVVLMFYFLNSACNINGKYSFGFNDNHRAKYVSKVVKKLNLKGNMFNDFDFGGYLIYKLYPEHKVFVDGRVMEYGYEFVENSFYYWKEEVFGNLDKEYNFSFAVIPNENYYNAYLFDKMDNWHLVYFDDYSLLYLKDNNDNNYIINKLGYKYIYPNAPDQSYLRAIDVDSAKKELMRAIYFSPEASRKAKRMLDFISN